MSLETKEKFVMSVVFFIIIIIAIISYYNIYLGISVYLGIVLHDLYFKKIEYSEI